jgi:hypothetical protein
MRARRKSACGTARTTTSESARGALTGLIDHDGDLAEHRARAQPFGPRGRAERGDFDIALLDDEGRVRRVAGPVDQFMRFEMQFTHDRLFSKVDIARHRHRANGIILPCTMQSEILQSFDKLLIHDPGLPAHWVDWHAGPHPDTTRAPSRAIFTACALAMASRDTAGPWPRTRRPTRGRHGPLESRWMSPCAKRP